MKKYYDLLFILFFVIIFFVFYCYMPISMDEIWNYGFSYNISHFLIPYYNFNMIITPMYSYILSFFIYVFGNSFYNLIILNSILSSILLYMLYKNYGKKMLFLIPFIMRINYACYNFLCLILFISFLILKTKNFKNKELYLGFLVALILLCKQTVGGLILIFSFIFSKNKKQYLLGFMPLWIIFLGYLILNNSLYQFFDYCLFGMLDFTSGNSLSNISYGTIIYCMNMCFMIYLLFKNKFKDSILNYIFIFQIMSLPILDNNHILVSIFPFIVYLLINYKTKLSVIKTIKTCFISFYIFISLFECIRFIFTNNYIKYRNKSSFLNNVLVSFNTNYIYEMDNYLKENYKGYRIFHFGVYAYLYRLELGYSIDKFDIVNKGNMGYNGEKRYTLEIDRYCQDNKCLFILDNEDINTQKSVEIYEYIYKNYKLIKDIGIYDIYIND